MRIVIGKIGELVTAKYFDSKETLVWKTQQPITMEQLVKELVLRGCHPRDVYDELHAQGIKSISPQIQDALRSATIRLDAASRNGIGSELSSYIRKGLEYLLGAPKNKS